MLNCEEFVDFIKQFILITNKNVSISLFSPHYALSGVDVLYVLYKISEEYNVELESLIMGLTDYSIENIYNVLKDCNNNI